MGCHVLDVKSIYGRGSFTVGVYAPRVKLVEDYSELNNLPEAASPINQNALCT
jgi:hypothetical protein